MARRSSRLSALTAILVLGLSASAAAAKPSPPDVSTGAAKDVSYSSADLTGNVNPKASNTSYYFQFGATKAYGGQSTIADAGAGSSSVAVAVPIGGLQPLTVYHYRLVAVNATGATLGGDHTFVTTKVPLSLAILAFPSPVSFGAPVTVQGTLSGTENGGRQVILQAEQFPFTTGFQDVGNPELTEATGGFKFTLLDDTQTAQFRVVTTTNPAVVSPPVTEGVAVIVTSHVSKGRRRGYVRFYGTVTPAENGAQIGILHITHGHGVLAGGTTLKANSAASSKFSRELKVGKGVYRIGARLLDAAQVSAYGQPLVIG
jgi:hypothetical protein